MLKNSWGDGLVGTYGTLASGTAAAPVHTGAAAAGIVKNMVCAFHDADGGIFDIRTILGVSTNTFVLNRDLSFTPANLDPVIPLYTWTPHIDATCITDLVPTATIKARSRSAPLDGLAFNWRGVAHDCVLEGISPRGTLMAHITGMPDDWSEETPQDLVITSLRDHTKPPIVVGSRCLWGYDTLYTAVETWDMGISPNLTVTPYEANSGARGRAGFGRFYSAAPEVSFTMPWDDRLVARIKKDYATTAELDDVYQSFEMQLGKNSLGTSLTTDHGYGYVYIHAAALRSIAPVKRNNQLCAKVTIKALSPVVRGAPNIAPMIIAIAGGA